MSRAPTLETERLILRPMTMADWPAYKVLWETERSVHMGGPAGPDESWGYFCSDAAMWDLFGHGALMIDDRTTGECYGQVAINHGPWFPEKELGWMVYPEAEGKGLAYEAAKALLDWGYQVAKLDTLVSYIDPENARSIALAKKLGAALDNTAPRQDPEDLVFRHPKP